MLEQLQLALQLHFQSLLEENGGEYFAFDHLQG